MKINLIKASPVLKILLTFTEQIFYQVMQDPTFRVEKESSDEADS